jgi:hypothetical protein
LVETDSKTMKNGRKTSAVIGVLVAAFAALAVAFFVDAWGRIPHWPEIPLVDPELVQPDTVRESYAELVRKKEDLSDFDCYACHEKGVPPPIRYDTNHNIIIPKEHSNIVMGHGRHDRNNNCFNCHNENNLEHFQTRDGRELTFAESTPLCGSCHGPTYRDWEAGAHGRSNGEWSRAEGRFERQDCVACHDPHAPKFPGRKPLPPPHPLRTGDATATTTKH